MQATVLSSAIKRTIVSEYQVSLRECPIRLRKRNQGCEFRVRGHSKNRAKTVVNAAFGRAVESAIRALHKASFRIGGACFRNEAEGGEVSIGRHPENSSCATGSCSIKGSIVPQYYAGVEHAAARPGG